MPKDFSELSSEAQSAIVDAVLDIDVPNLSEFAKAEIREWGMDVDCCDECNGEGYLTEQDYWDRKHCSTCLGSGRC